MTIDDFLETIDDERERDRIRSDYVKLLKIFRHEELFKFDLSLNKISYGIRFEIESDIYRSGRKLYGSIQYNIVRRNIVDWNSHIYMDVDRFIQIADDPEAIYSESEYAAWTDRQEWGKQRPDGSFPERSYE